MQERKTLRERIWGWFEIMFAVLGGLLSIATQFFPPVGVALGIGSAIASSASSISSQMGNRGTLFNLLFGQWITVNCNQSGAMKTTTRFFSFLNTRYHKRRRRFKQVFRILTHAKSQSGRSWRSRSRLIQEYRSNYGLLRLCRRKIYGMNSQQHGS